MKYSDSGEFSSFGCSNKAPSYYPESGNWISSVSSPADLPGRLVKPCGHSSLPVLMEMGLQDHAIPAGRHACLDP